MADFGLEVWFPLSQSLYTAFKADPTHSNAFVPCRLKHESANAIVCNKVHGDFLAYHLRRFTAQNIHVHGGFDVPEEQFHIPTLIINISNLAG